MFNRIKDFFAGDESLKVDTGGKPTDRDLQIATAVLLLEMAGRDQDFAPEEINVAFASMSRQFQLSDDETADILEAASTIQEQPEKIDELIKVLNERFSDKQRQKILAMIWNVVIADGRIDKFEERYAVQMKTRFKLSDEQALEARKLAEQRKV